MKYEINNKGTTLTLDNNNLLFKKYGRELSLESDNMFALEIDGCYLKSSDFNILSANINDNKILVEYKKEDISVRVLFYARDCGFAKKIIVDSNNRKINYLYLEQGRNDKKKEKGFEGFPVFIDDFMFVGIEFPACNNQYDEKGLNLYQSPFIKTSHFESYEVFYGFSNGNLDETFRKYIEDTSMMSKEMIRVYCNWGHYDNFTEGDPILDEKLAMDSLNYLKRLEKESQVKCDYYLMDAFWHEPHNKYLTYDKNVFPHGIAPFLKELSKDNLKYGLWFDINYIHNKPVDFGKYDTLLDNGSFCFACDEVYLGMEKALAKHIKEDNLKIIKLDFAYFNCKNKEHDHSIKPVERKEKAVTNFIKMINNLYKINPDLKVFCYNGWTISDDALSPAIKREKVISPYWTRYVTNLYCGDPRPSEIATPIFARTLVYYSDVMLRNFYDSYIPLSMIDDHGSMCGKTGTIYYLGKDNFKQSIIMNLMRGTYKINPYGNIGLLDKDDYDFYRFVNKIADKVDKNSVFSFVFGDIRDNQVYGYKLNLDNEGYVIIHNPTSKEVKIENSKEVTILVVDDELTSMNTSSSFSINPFGYVFLRFSGKDIDLSADLSVEKPIFERLPKLLELENNHSKKLYINFEDENGSPLRTFINLKNVHFKDENGNELQDNQPDKNLWSGVSWKVFNIEKARKIIVSNDEKEIINYHLRME